MKLKNPVFALLVVFGLFVGLRTFAADTPAPIAPPTGPPMATPTAIAPA